MFIGIELSVQISSTVIARICECYGFSLEEGVQHPLLTRAAFARANFFVSSTWAMKAHDSQADHMYIIDTYLQLKIHPYTAHVSVSCYVGWMLLARCCKTCAPRCLQPPLQECRF